MGEWLLAREWTNESIVEWQEFYNTAPRDLVYGGAGNRPTENLPHLPEYKDLKPEECQRGSLTTNYPSTTSPIIPIGNAAIDQSPLILLTLFSALRAIF